MGDCGLPGCSMMILSTVMIPLPSTSTMVGRAVEPFSSSSLSSSFLMPFLGGPRRMLDDIRTSSSPGSPPVLGALGKPVP